MRETVSTIWKDPVGSSVISGLILAFIIWMITKFVAKAKGISMREYFRRKLSISVGKILIFGTSFFIVGILIYSFQEQIKIYQYEIMLFGPYIIGSIILIFLFSNIMKTADRIIHNVASKIESNEESTELALEKMEKYEKEIKSEFK